MNEEGASVSSEQRLVLFVSRRNSLRSVLADACLAHVGRGRCRSHSCGVPEEVAHAVHPVAFAALKQAGIVPLDHKPQGWGALRVSGPRPDVVILLDPLEDVDLPRWPGQPGMALWSYPDLAARGPDLALADASQMLHSLRRRLEILVTLLTRASEGTALRGDIRDMAFL